MVNLKNLCVLATCAAILTACNSDSDNSSSNNNITPAPVVTNSPLNINLKFAALVNNKDFVCGTTYSPVGTAVANSYKMTDFRFYVHNIKLLKTDSSQVSVSLTQDNKWQTSNIALLDFENGCLNGTSETNSQVVGTVPYEASPNYTGVCVTLGLPFNSNHIDSSTAPSPLNVTGMLWSWTTGRKFIRIDGVADPDVLKQNYFIHLGSTGCVDTTKTGIAPSSPCSYPNTVEMCFNNFDVNKDSLVADVADVLRASNLTYNTPNTAAGCMSGNNDPECIEVMPRLGLDFTYTDGVNPAVKYPRQSDFLKVRKP